MTLILRKFYTNGYCAEETSIHSMQIGIGIIHLINLHISISIYSINKIKWLIILDKIYIIIMHIFLINNFKNLCNNSICY